MKIDTRELNNAVRQWAPFARTEIVAHVHDAAEMEHPPAPAWYEPKKGDLHVHQEAAGVADSTAVFTSGGIGSTDKMVARVGGLVIHEAAHSAWSDWMMHVKIPAILAPIVTMLEELRIEKRAVDKRPVTRKPLRASFSILNTGEAMADADKITPLMVSHNWALLVGRSYTGVADPKEVEAVDTAGRTLLGDEAVDQLVDLIQDAIESRGPRLVDIAEEWVDIVGLDGYELIVCGCAHEKGEKVEAGGKSAAVKPEPRDEEEDEKDDDDESKDGTGGDADDETEDEEDKEDGEGEGDGDEADAGDDDDGDAEDSNPGEVDAVTEKLTPRDGKILDDAIKAATDVVVRDWRKDPDIDLADPLEWAAKVFGKRRSSAQTGRSWEHVEATSEQRRDVTRAALALERLVLPAIGKTKFGSDLPPGRLRSREALRASADRAAGRMTEAKMWTTTRRRHSHSKPIIVGIATDTSGSMRWAEKAVAEFAYVMSNAGTRVGARTAAVTFGDDVEAVTWPGEPGARVAIRAADGGSEEFDRAMAALDGSLKLTHQSGAAKLLLIVSDGNLVKTLETARMARWMKKFDDAGVTVIWLSASSVEHVKAAAPKVHAKRVDLGHRSDENVARAILRTAIATIEKDLR